MAICALMSACARPVRLSCVSMPVAHTSNLGSPVLAHIEFPELRSAQEDLE
jgi:hypothetical protein